MLIQTFRSCERERNSVPENQFVEQKRVILNLNDIKRYAYRAFKTRFLKLASWTFRKYSKVDYQPHFRKLTLESIPHPSVLKKYYGIQRFEVETLKSLRRAKRGVHEMEHIQYIQYMGMPYGLWRTLSNISRVFSVL